MRFYLLPALALPCLLLCGCATVLGTPVSSPPVPREGAPPQIVMSADYDVSVSTFYSKKIRGQTHWKYGGSLPQGDVYRPLDTVFTVESGNVQEAYLVVRGHDLVGYYMPVERNFEKLEPSVSLDFTTNN